MSRGSRLVATLAVAASLTLSASAVSAAHAPRAQAARGCSVGAGSGYGYSYLTSLNVTATSCATGRYVAKHHGHLRGWGCSRTRLDTSPVQYDERVACKSGARRAKWTYTQNT
jgi:hypothetical protein